MPNRIQLSPAMNDCLNLFLTNEQRVQAKLIKGIQHWQSRLPSYAERLAELDALISLASQSVVSFPFRQSYFRHMTHQVFSHFGITESNPLPPFPLFFVTIASKRDRRRHPTFFNTSLLPIDFQIMDRITHSILRGLHYIGYVDIGAYLYTGYEPKTYRELSPHHHLITWGCSQKELKERFGEIRIQRRVSCKFRRIRHVEIQKYSRRNRQLYPHQLSFGRVFSYCHKFICKEVVKGSRRKESVDKHGVVHPVEESYKYERQIPGNKTRIVVYRWLKDVPLFNFCIGGGDGAALVKAAKRGCLREIRRRNSDSSPNFVSDNVNFLTLTGESHDKSKVQPAHLPESSPVKRSLPDALPTALEIQPP
jgi:hypothetical protein